MQRFLLITIIFILSGILIYLAFFYFSEDFSNKTAGIAEDGYSLLSQFRKTLLSQPSVIRISDNGAQAYGIIPGNKGVAYFDMDGKFSISDFIGSEKQTVSESVGGKVLQSLWFSNKMEVILTLITQNGLGKLYYDYQNGKATLLDNRIQNISFSPDNSKLAYNFFDDNTYDGSISISRVDGSSFVKIFKTRLSDIKIQWPQENLISFHKAPSEDEPIDLFTIDNEGENFTKLLENKKGLKVVWSPDGKNLIYSVNNGRETQLNYMFIESRKEKELGLNTSADQCVWGKDNSNIICYLNRTFYLLNVLDNSKEELYQFRAGLQIKEMKLSPLENYLLFINQEDGQLYSLVLK